MKTPRDASRGTRAVPGGARHSGALPKELFGRGASARHPRCLHPMHFFLSQFFKVSPRTAACKDSIPETKLETPPS